MKSSHTPSAAQFRTLIDWMRTNIPKGTEFFMPDCTACVAGTIGRIAYRLGATNRTFSYIDDNDDNESLLNYWGGKYFVAEMLGCENPLELEGWAGDNPEIWGNDRGLAMFGGYTWAYEKPRHEQRVTPTTVVSIEQVLTHLEGVAERLEAKERQTGYDFDQWLKEPEKETANVG